MTIAAPKTVTAMNAVDQSNDLRGRRWRGASDDMEASKASGPEGCKQDGNQPHRRDVVRIGRAQTPRIGEHERYEGKTMGFLIVFLGGGLGAALRHGVNLGFARAFGTYFPYATMFENVSGSLAMGL